MTSAGHRSQQPLDALRGQRCERQAAECAENDRRRLAGSSAVPTEVVNTSPCSIHAGPASWRCARFRTSPSVGGRLHLPVTDREREVANVWPNHQ